MNLDNLSSLAASNKLVPFLGAGCSYGHLKLDWDSISAEMAEQISIQEVDNLLIAEQYVSIKGLDGLCAFLKNKLLTNEYDENLDIVPLIIASLGVGLIYTTNQDNVFEKCAEKYGRTYKTISTLDDLSSYLPGDSMYVKYHGDLADSNTVIFTQSSYFGRINDPEHFLNIRMKSDLLGKSFLFIGYSFRDPNVSFIFEELHRAFKGKMPSSYLIAFEYTKELKELSERYGITIINPLDEIPDCKEQIEAFEKYMVSLCTQTYSKKIGLQIDSMFRPQVPESTKVVSQYEISGVEQAVKKAPKRTDALDLFRATFDLSLIPECYQNKVVSMFIDMCRSCRSRQESDALKAAIFNLKLSDENLCYVLSGVLTTAIYRDEKEGFDFFHPINSSLNEAIYPLAAAAAIEMIRKWKIEMKDSFRGHVQSWIRGYKNFPEEHQSYIEGQIAWAWSEHTIYENPISYLKRVGDKSPFGLPKTFQDILRDISERLPKQLIKPYEE